MQKIMFESKRFGLEQAVLAGMKTMTRRIIKGAYVTVIHLKYEGSFIGKTADGDSVILPQPTYKIGEQVAIAQAYENIPMEHFMKGIDDPMKQYFQEQLVKQAAAYKNKLFAIASLMPHVIEITDIKVERLQDISDGDCLKEGITTITEGKSEVGNAYGWDPKIDALKRDSFFMPRAAFAALIDRLNGRGTWQNNPWVYAYTFELIK